VATLNQHITSHREVRESEPVYTTGVSSAQATLANIIWFVFGVIMVLLAIRFVFELLGANPSNAIANFIYTTSHPFAAPFFGLFHYNVLQTGVSRFEVYTLVAIAVYGLIAWALTSLVMLNRRY